MESFLESVGNTLTDMTACAQIVLEHLSWYLADHTGFDADTCTPVPAFAASVAAVSVLSPCLDRWLSLPMSFERAQRPGRSPAPVLWAAQSFDDVRQKFHFAIAGLPRSGKSLMLLLYLAASSRRSHPGQIEGWCYLTPKSSSTRRSSRASRSRCISCWPPTSGLAVGTWPKTATALAPPPSPPKPWYPHSRTTVVRSLPAPFETWWPASSPP